jgi:hypothetical protein
MNPVLKAPGTKRLTLLFYILLSNVTFNSNLRRYIKAFDFATNEIFHVAETVDGGGDCLVYMVTNPELEGRGAGPAILPLFASI